MSLQKSLQRKTVFLLLKRDLEDKGRKISREPERDDEEGVL